MDGARVHVHPITPDDTAAVSVFLHDHLNSALPPRQWRSLLEPPWDATAPNSGFMLVQDARIVGAYAAVYSRRVVAGEKVAFCNLAAFCVLDPYRMHSLRLARAILAQPGYEFTDFSPSGSVVALNERLGFRRLDTASVLCVNAPLPPRRGLTVTSEPSELAEVLHGEDLAVYRDHRATAARHVAVARGERYAYLIVRRERRKRLPWFAVPVYAAGDIGLLREAWPQLLSHLGLRLRLPFTLAEPRVLGFAPRGYRPSRSRPKMFRSQRVDAAQIDGLYSELVLLEW